MIQEEEKVEQEPVLLPSKDEEIEEEITKEEEVIIEKEIEEACTQVDDIEEEPGGVNSR